MTTTTTELYIGAISMMPTEIAQRVANDDSIRLTRATLGRNADGTAWREAYGRNPVARFDHWNDYGSITAVDDDGEYHPYLYHSGIRVVEIRERRVVCLPGGQVVVEEVSS